MNLPRSIQNLITAFSRLPGVGPKTAERLAFFVLKQDDEFIQVFSSSLNSLKESIKFCENCFNIDEISPCSICSNSSRDKSQICVVETALDLIAIEKTNSYRGLYHVLHGILSPIDGIGPKDIKIAELLNKVDTNVLKEIIFALNPCLEGEATIAYIKNQLRSKNIDVKTTKIARGMPTGSNLEYADNLTIENALNGRQEL